jgi:acetolactate synthase-1/2/3 large subunit
VKTVLVKHEQGAAFMAGGYARVSHRVSACIATAGPGATNLVTGIANAYAERLPVLIITGETSTYIFGKGGLQESSGEGGAIDQGVLFSSITRYHKLIERTDYLGQVLNQATRALYGREPGPVLLSIPYNVQKENWSMPMCSIICIWKPCLPLRRQSCRRPCPVRRWRIWPG